MADKRKFYLTPDFPNDESPQISRAFIIPSEPVELIANVMGAISVLYEDNNWLQYGDMNAEETAQFYRGLQFVTDLCSWIAENCLTDFSEGGFVDTMIDSIGNGQGGGGGAGTNAISNGVLGTDLYINGSCDDNERYGICYEIVGALDTQAVDMLDVLQDGSNEYLTALDLLGNIPVLNVITSAIFDSATELASYIVDEIVLSYNAAYNTTIREEIACRIYQNSDCDITLGDVIAGYEDYITDVLTLPSGRDMIEVVQWLSGLSSLINVMIVATMHWLILQVFAHLSSWFGSPSRVLIIATSQASAIPPPLTCVDEFLRLEGEGNIGMSSLPAGSLGVLATYDSGQDVYVAAYDNTGSFQSRQMHIRFTMGTPRAITSVTWDFEVMRTDASGGLNLVLLQFDGSTVASQAITASGTPQSYTLSWAGTANVTNIDIVGGVFVTSPSNGMLEAQRLSVQL